MTKPGRVTVSIADTIRGREMVPRIYGTMYIPVERFELVAESVCETLGHFYESFECIYCGVGFCATEMGGHSFESTYAMWLTKPSDTNGVSYCYRCKQQLVNLRKG